MQIAWLLQAALTLLGITLAIKDLGAQFAITANCKRMQNAPTQVCI